MSIIVIHRRKKCIGCHYCADVAPEFFTMDNTDGKAILKGAKQKKGIYTLKVINDTDNTLKEAQKVCPLKIIDVRPL